MDSKIKYTIKILSTNLLFFLIFLIMIELIFGYWFEKYNFGPYMREHRLKKIPYQMTYNGTNYKYNYLRNSLAFRGEEISAKEIKIIMVGGSTTDERYKPENLSIVGILNTKFREDSLEKKIINAGVEGQSTFGHIHNFKYWFNKIEDFKPDFIIFYIGVNDTKSLTDNYLQDGMIEDSSKLRSFFDNVKSRSFLADLLRKVKHKYYKRDERKRIIYDYDHSMRESEKQNKIYLNFDEKKKIYNLEDVVYKNKLVVEKYLKNIDTLYKLTKLINAEPIFINQVMQQDEYSDVLYSLNRSLVSHCIKKNYKFIDLAKQIKGSNDFWWDGVHTTPKGSEAIANEIYPKLKKFLRN